MPASMEKELQNVDITELQYINKCMWGLEELAIGETDLQTLGCIFLLLRHYNKKRIAEKNRIAKQHGEKMETKMHVGVR